MVSIDALDLGKVTHEHMVVDTGLTHIPVPLTDSGTSIDFAWLGRKRTITLQGTKIGTVSAIKTFLDQFIEENSGWLNTVNSSNWATGGIGEKTYTNDFSLEGGITVKPVNFEYDYDENTPSRVTYSLVMVQS